MLQKDRVAKAIQTLKDSVVGGDARLDFEDATMDCADYLQGRKPLDKASGAFALVDHSPRFDVFAAGLNEGTPEVSLALLLSLKWMGFDIMRHSIAKDVFVYHEFSFDRALGIDAPLFQAAGWIEQSEAIAQYVWGKYYSRNIAQADVLFGKPSPAAWGGQHTNPYLVNKPAWFTTMTTIERNMWNQYGYDPDMDSLGPYWMLAQVWDDPDPAKVRNALLATREHNIGTTFIKDVPEGNRVYLVDEFLLLYDYDIRSVNMRRKLMGLPVVEVEDYIYDMDLPLEVLPFAKDDVFYPAYVKMCEELGVAPYVPDNSIDVRVDPETLLVTRV